MNQHTNTIIPDFRLRVSDLISVPTGSALFPETLLSTPLSSPQQQATLPLSTSASSVPVVDALGLDSTLDMTFDFGALNPSPPAAQSLLSWDSLPLNTLAMDFGAFLDNNTQLQQQYDIQAPASSTVPVANQDPSKWLSDDLFDLSVFGVTTMDNVEATKALDPTHFTFVSTSAPSSPVPSLEPLPAHTGTPPPLASPLAASDATVIYSPVPSMALSAAAGAATGAPHLSSSSLPASPFSFLSQQQPQHHHQQLTLDQLFLDATANVPVSTSAGGSPAAVVQPTTAVVDDLDAILADLPDLEPTTPSAPAPNVVASAAPAAKRQRRRPPANELPPIVHVPTLSADASTAATTLAIPTSTRKSKAKVASLPTLLEYPKDMIAHDAPILSNKRKRTNKRSAATAELDDPAAAANDDDNEILPSDPSLVSDPAAAKRITNALSARRSRARKQAKLEFFETRVHELEAANAQLAAQVAHLQAQLRAANLEPVQGAGSSSAIMS
ncbi:hypothetical protein BCR44DRAFT_31010 [Catenaria anguillulae PL171]|uniref:BZIP domain-containing protein n=1 Tax=Catenaria anguillulae PL171 TaxID=765915 RepID=A0A1Y2I2L4_9FUNG|nr:hypothetical protein BCR44DRAFT_31010 [Catenaria anguillulae PL171]